MDEMKYENILNKQIEICSEDSYLGDGNMPNLTYDKDGSGSGSISKFKKLILLMRFINQVKATFLYVCTIPV